MKNKYYVRIKTEDIPRFEVYAADNGIDITHLSNDFKSTMYSANMSGEEALSLSLSFPLVGCLNFQKTMTKLSHKID